jgi:hypothetical protein
MEESVLRWANTSVSAVFEFLAVQSGHNSQFATVRTEQSPLGMPSPTAGYHHPNLSAVTNRAAVFVTERAALFLRIGSACLAQEEESTALAA